MSFLVSSVADDVLRADRPAGRPGAPGYQPSGMQPVALRVGTGRQPANTQSCWSSYPFIDDQLLPVMQAVNPANGQVVFTLVNANTHAETLAFSSNAAYQATLTGDWPARMRSHLEASFPGSVGVEMSGLVGSVETPTVYEPESTQVIDIPGAYHSVPGNPDGCSSVYPEPVGATPVTDAVAFLDAYGGSVADAAGAALSQARTLTPDSLVGQHQSLCVQLENNFFIAAFAAGLFPDRPAYADPACTVGLSSSGSLAVNGGPAGHGHSPKPTWIRTDVGVLTLGPIQISYSPGEVFPFTETRGAMDEAQMPFPTDCYNPITSDYNCGRPLPMTPWTSAEMTGSYRFMAGLGEDMIGYLFPPGNFVGNQGATEENPWAAYENTHSNGADRFGYGHSDDSESVGPYAGLAVTRALQGLLAQAPRDDGPAQVLPGLFIDASGRLADSPFASPRFGGAVGVEVVGPSGERQVYLVGRQASGWATYDATVDAGTAGTTLAYSVATAGVTLSRGALLVDVFAGARLLAPEGA